MVRGKRKKELTIPEYMAEVNNLEEQAKQIRQQINDAKRDLKAAQEKKQIAFERSLAQSLIKDYHLTSDNQKQFLKYVKDLLAQHPFEDQLDSTEND
ncbi:hypothetical protein [Limosilactobacillus gastricus]|uniref:hypothetical protein n=1 Tax=Limosilactobacillus gastricus TaxID=227942 RepID=UPI0026F2A08B|nr:hypothetical protein [Limosilactobacillus gastricus]